MNFFLDMQDENDTLVSEFEPSSDTASEETASEVSEIITAADAVEDSAEKIEDGLVISETVESLICVGKIATSGEPVNMGMLYATESLFGTLVARNFPGEAITKPDFESHVAGGESAMRARIGYYCSEGFLEQAKQVVARIVAFLKEQFQNAVTFLMQLFTSAAKMKKSYEEIVSELGKEADYNVSSDKEIKVSVSYLNDGKKADPLAAVKAAKTMYDAVQSSTKKLASTATAAFKSAATAENTDEIIQSLEKSRSESYSGHSSALTVSGFKPITTKGRLTFVAGKSIEKSSIPAMSKSDLISFAKAGIELAGAIEKHKENIKEINKMRDEEIKAIDATYKAANESKEGTESESARTTELRRKLIAMTKASTTIEVASLSKASALAFRVLAAGLSCAKANKALLAKKK